MRVVVENAQVVERLSEVGPVGGGVLRHQLPPNVGGLLEGGLGVGEAVRVVVELSEVVERLSEVGPVGGGVLRRQRPPELTEIKGFVSSARRTSAFRRAFVASARAGRGLWSPCLGFQIRVASARKGENGRKPKRTAFLRGSPTRARGKLGKNDGAGVLPRVAGGREGTRS